MTFVTEAEEGQTAPPLTTTPATTSTSHPQVAPTTTESHGDDIFVTEAEETLPVGLPPTPKVSAPPTLQAPSPTVAHGSSSAQVPPQEHLNQQSSDFITEAEETSRFTAQRPTTLDLPPPMRSRIFPKPGQGWAAVKQSETPSQQQQEDLYRNTQGRMGMPPKDSTPGALDPLDFVAESEETTPQAPAPPPPPPAVVDPGLMRAIQLSCMEDDTFIDLKLKPEDVDYSGIGKFNNPPTLSLHEETSLRPDERKEYNDLKKEATEMVKKYGFGDSNNPGIAIGSYHNLAMWIRLYRVTQATWKRFRRGIEDRRRRQLEIETVLLALPNEAAKKQALLEYQAHFVSQPQSLSWSTSSSHSVWPT